MEKSELPKISGYGEYSSENYGVNCLRVDLKTLSLYYSYDTIVAYKDFQDGLVVRENDWGPTTGKHINWIDGGNKRNRLSEEKFEEKLQLALARHIL
jgi:hypothetical protein